MKKKTKIEKQLREKRNQGLVETIIAAKRAEGWRGIAGILSGSTRKRPSINLDKINLGAKEGETVVVPGKVLSLGDLDKKIKIVALGASENALEKIKKAKCEFITIEEEIKLNPGAKGIIILK